MMARLGEQLGELLRVGVSLHKDPAVRRRVRLSNSMALILTAVLLAYFPILYGAGLKLLAWVILLIAAAYLSVLPLNYAGRFTLARLALITFLNGAIFFYSGYLGIGAGGHLYFLATACLPIIIASIRERGLITYGVGVSILFFEVLTLARDRVFPEPIIGPVTQNWIHRAAVVPTTFLILLAELIYFSLSNERAEERLERNREFRLLLDNAGQGFLTVDKDGHIGTEWSLIIETWLGTVHPGAPFAEALRPLDEAAADWFELNWDALFQDCLPVEVAIEQLPKALRVGDLHLAIEYRPFFATEAARLPDRVLIVISNVTSEVERSRVEAAQHEVLRVVDQVMRDRHGFREFQRETSRLFAQLASSPTLAEQKLILHTLKGSCGLFGVHSVAERCHTLEDALAEGEVPPSAEQIRWLRTAWDELCERVRPIINGADDTVELRAGEYQTFMAALRRRIPHRELLSWAETWCFEPAELRFHRIAEQARALAKRLHKGEPEIVISGGEVRLDPGRWAPFFSAFSHVVRNSIDHGLETPEEREAAGKPACGSLTLWAELRGGNVIIGITDDGRGINWENVAARARAMGLPADTHADLIEALCADGLSTRTEVTDVSGRGVGMAAIRRECNALGGWIEITSRRGQGSSFEFHIPTTHGLQGDAISLAPGAPSVRNPSALRALSSSREEGRIYETVTAHPEDRPAAQG